MDSIPLTDALPGVAAAGGERFDALVPTIFHSAWWLDAVAPGGWAESIVVAGGKTVGRFPYAHTRLALRQSISSLPPLTHFLGPAIDAGSGAACNRALKRAQITRELLAGLRPATGYYHKCSRAVTDTIVFQELGFAAGVQFTFEIAPAPREVLWRNMRDKTRNVIRRAEETLHVCQMPDVAAFADFYHRNLARDGRENYYPPALIRRVASEAIGRGQGQIWSAGPPGGDAVAAIFCVSDAVSTYYLLTTRTADAGNGAIPLLLWTAIQHSAARGLIFDFDGVAGDGARVFFTGFGGEVRPRYTISRFTRAHRMAGRLSNPFGKARSAYY